MDRVRDRDDAFADGEETVREGNLVIEEGIARREGLVEYEGTAGEGTTVREGARTVTEVTEVTETVDPPPSGGVLGGAMQAGATVLGGAARTDDVGTAAPAGEETTVGASTRDMDPLSMSTDNSASGLMTADTVESGPITRVREGMRVVDANGDDLGTVADVKMGDPAAMTIVGEEPAGDQGIFGGGGGPDLPEAFRNELLRVGYVRIDAKGWFGRDHYASANQIAEVSGDTVRLTVAKDALST